MSLPVPQVSAFIRFIISGGFNTAITYGVYLILLNLMPYQLSYTIAYSIGIALAYALNRSFVFRSHKGWFSILLLPLVYVAQYGFGISLLWFFIDIAGISDVVSPLIVALFSVPFTYFLTRVVFLKNGSENLNMVNK